MRELLESSDPRAAEAVDLFVYRIGRELGSMAAALGGLDALVFTGGIGENAAAIRERVCRDARWLGLELDDAANAAGGPRISRPGEPRGRMGRSDERGADDRPGIRGGSSASRQSRAETAMRNGRRQWNRLAAMEPPEADRGRPPREAAGRADGVTIVAATPRATSSGTPSSGRSSF